MSTTLNKLEYLDETKAQIKTALNTNFNAGITDNDTFRSYVDKINNIYTNWEKVTGEGTELTLNNTKKGKMVLGLKGNTSQESTTGKNKLDVTQNEVGSWTTDGSSSTNNRNRRGTQFIPVEPNTAYTFSVNSAVSTLRINEYDTNQSHIQRDEESSSASITITTTANTHYLRWSINYDNTNVFTEEMLVALKPQIEQGSSSTSWEKYTGGQASPNPQYKQDIHRATGDNNVKLQGSSETSAEQNAPLSLGNIELCKIGDYQDYLYKENGNWYKYEAVGKIIFNGSETNWVKSSNTNIDRYVLPTTIYLNYSDSKCNYFIKSGVNTTLWRWTNNSSSQLMFNFAEAGTTTLEDWLTWLSTHNLEVLQPLATPNITQITDTTLIEQLEAIANVMSYDEQTNISQTNDDLPFIINASALKKGGN